jgi:hypothetical protein
MPRTDEEEPSVAADGPATSGRLLESVQIDRVRERLRHEFQNRLDAGVVDRHVEGALDELGEVRIRTYLPILIERNARSTLRQRAGSQPPAQRLVAEPAVSEPGLLSGSAEALHLAGGVPARRRSREDPRA